MDFCHLAGTLIKNVFHIMIMRGHFLRRNLMTGDFDENYSKAELQSKSSAIRMDEDRRQGNEEMDSWCDWQRRRTQPERSDFKIVR